MTDSSFVLVTGATGRQGGATAHALLRAGEQVHALVRDPAAPRAAALAERGATLVTGDLEDRRSLLAALDGARGVFSVQMPDFVDGDLELRHAGNLAETARKAGVAQIVHTSVSGVDDWEPGDEERWGPHLGQYWRSKAAAEQAARDAGAARVTILRPSTFMENFAPPSFYSSERDPDRVLVAVDPEVPQPFVAVEDIGAAAAAAFADPARFDGVVLELAGDVLTFREAIAILSDVTGRPRTLPADPAAAEAEGLRREFVVSQQYTSARPQPARPELARALGLTPMTFAEWALASRGALV